MDAAFVPIIVAFIGLLGTIGVAIIQTRQNKRVSANTNKLDSQEALFAIVLEDLEQKEKRLRRFERFFQDIGLATPEFLKERMDRLEHRLDEHRGTHDDSDNA